MRLLKFSRYREENTESKDLHYVLGCFEFLLTLICTFKTSNVLCYQLFDSFKNLNESNAITIPLMYDVMSPFASYRQLCVLNEVNYQHKVCRRLFYVDLLLVVL